MGESPEWSAPAFAVVTVVWSEGLAFFLRHHCPPPCPVTPPRFSVSEICFLSTVDLGNLKGQPETQVR